VPSAYPRGTDLAFDPDDPKVLYGTSYLGVLRSIDGGENWTDFSHGAIDGVNGAFPLLVRGHTLFASSACGLFRTADGGLTWSESLACVALPGGLPRYRYIFGMVGDPVDPLTLYALDFETSDHPGSPGSTAPLGYLYKSSDGGATWAAIEPDVWHLAIDPSHPATLYAYRFGVGIVKSTDGGVSWQTLTTLQVNDLVVDRLSPATVLAATLDQGVMRSTDGGITWRRFNVGLASRDRLSIAALVQHPDTPHLFFAVEGFWTGLFAAELPAEP
jgi:photosystem II stability/assembly factor-like uncharacterized protein